MVSGSSINIAALVVACEMLPRKPTRIELQPDDMKEYDQVLAARARQERQQAATASGTRVGVAGSESAVPSGGSAGWTSRQPTKAERIGLIK